MSNITIWTLDWVPPGPRGFVRDLRLRWASEEAGLSYALWTIPFDGRESNHLARQPFGQVPFLDDGDVRILESGACLLHLARTMPAAGREFLVDVTAPPAAALSDDPERRL